MEHWKELLIQACSTVMFCTAITLLFLQGNSYRSALDAYYSCYEDKGVLLCCKEPALDKRMTYGEVIGSMMGPLEYDVEIDDILIYKHEHTIEQIPTYCIKKSDFIKSYLCDSEGDIIRIIYRSIGG